MLLYNQILQRIRIKAFSIANNQSLNLFQKQDCFPLVCRKFGNFSAIRETGKVSPLLPAPKHIIKPSYHDTGIPPGRCDEIEIKNNNQIENLKKSCTLAREILTEICSNVKIGISTEELDEIARQLIFQKEAYPSPLNYHKFPKSICTSVNNVACHGIPDNRQLEDGDIISIDCTVYYNGYHGDCCETVEVGNVDEQGKQLVKVAKACRDAGISVCGPGVPFQQIGAKIEEVSKNSGVSIAPCFTGHGIGEYFHGPPSIFHHYFSYPGKMLPGMTFTVEPVICQGEREIEVDTDGWTAFTVDGGRAAQFEHTILITENGFEILT